LALGSPDVIEATQLKGPPRADYNGLAGVSGGLNEIKWLGFPVLTLKTGGVPQDESE
jgi:hypothetical protein